MSKPIIIGVDVSKGYADFVALNSEKEVVVDHFRLDDNKVGHSALTELLRGLKKKHKVKRVVFVVESTGGLEDNWLRLVKTAPLVDFVEGFRLNPKAIHHEYRVQNRNSISDGISSLTIAEHVAKNLENFEPNEVVVDDNYAAARSLIRHIVTLQENCTEHKNGLQQLLYQYLPSLVPIIPKSWAMYFLQILIIHGSKRAIQMAAKQGFKQILRVPKGKAKEIHEALVNGIDINETPPLIVATLKSKARKIQAIKEEIDELEKLLCQTAPVNKEQVKLLCSIKGMGVTTATVLLCFIEDIDRFDDASSIAAFFGVQPRLKSSGDGTIRTGMSKQGSGLVRRELYLLSFRTLGNDSYLKSIYTKQRQKGKTHDSALGVLMHKLIRMIYGILKSGKSYDPGIDQLNQIDPRNSDVEVPTTKRKADPKRRFQAESMDAPLSNRQRRNRKKDQELQAAAMADIAESS